MQDASAHFICRIFFSPRFILTRLFWTFTFVRNGKTVAEIKKKWAGLLAEAYTDKDNFMLDIQDFSLTDEDRKVLLAASIFIDLAYFEKKD